MPVPAAQARRSIGVLVLLIVSQILGWALYVPVAFFLVVG